MRVRIVARDAIQFSFSPDSRRVVFMDFEGPHSTDIEGRLPPALLTGAAHRFWITPDGARVTSVTEDRIGQSSSGHV